MGGLRPSGKVAEWLWQPVALRHAGSAAQHPCPTSHVAPDRHACSYGGDEVDLTQGMRNYLSYNLARASGQYATR